MSIVAFPLHLVQFRRIEPAHQSLDLVVVFTIVGLMAGATVSPPDAVDVGADLASES